MRLVAGIASFLRSRPKARDHRAPAVRSRLVDEARAGVRVDGRERARPIAPSRPVVENRLTGPGRRRTRVARIAYCSAAA